MSDTRILEVRYIATAKTQPGFDEAVAFGWDGKEWAYVFPESVLRSWLDILPADPIQQTTLYGVLGVSREASQDEIRSAFRKKAREWHTDVNTVFESNHSNDAFVRIKEAYDILSNPNTRARYNAGLALEASLQKQDKADKTITYRAPKKCGYVLAEGSENSRGQFVVSQILDWQHITKNGKTLKSFWSMNDRKVVEYWR
jgi:hypothetical protein